MSLFKGFGIIILINNYVIKLCMALDEIILQIGINSLENNGFLNYSLYQSGELEIEWRFGKTNFRLLGSDNKNLIDYVEKLDLNDQIYGDGDDTFGPVIGISIVKNDTQKDIFLCWNYKPSIDEMENFFKFKQLVRNVNKIAEDFVGNKNVRTIIQNASKYLKKESY